MAHEQSTGAAATTSTSWIARRAKAFERDSAGAVLTSHVVVRGDPNFPEGFMPNPDDPRASLRVLFGSAGGRTRFPKDAGSRLGAPPIEVGGIVRIDCAQRTHPKPWACFDPNNPNGEQIKIVLEGPDGQLRRYATLAAASWREFRDASLPKRLRDLRARVLLARNRRDGDDDQAKLWTLLVFLISWQPDAPRILNAERRTWVLGQPNTSIRADDPNIELFFRSLHKRVGTPDAVAASDPSNSRKHFWATLRPDLFTASAEVLAWIESRCRAGGEEARKGKMAASNESTNRSLRPCVRKAGKAFEHLALVRDDLLPERGKSLSPAAWNWIRENEYSKGKAPKFEAFGRYVRQYFQSPDRPRRISALAEKPRSAVMAKREFRKAHD